MAGEGLAEVTAQIAEAAAEAGRDPRQITLVAVSKTFGAEAVAPLIAAGQRHFGENRVQEARAKWPALTATQPDLRLHLIGPLQTNKVRDAVQLFHAIHSLDRDRLAGELARERARQGRQPELFVQVNTGREPQKSGVAPDEAAAFVARCRAVHGLAIGGLMCIPPADAPPEPHFLLLRDLARRAEVAGLSMGMSDDYRTAIRFGATHLRIGSAIFGRRG